MGMRTGLEERDEEGRRDGGRVVGRRIRGQDQAETHMSEDSGLAERGREEVKEGKGTKRK